MKKKERNREKILSTALHLRKQRERTKERKKKKKRENNREKKRESEKIINYLASKRAEKPADHSTPSGANQGIFLLILTCCFGAIIHDP